MLLNHALIKSNPFIRPLLTEENYTKCISQVTLVKLKPQEILFREGDFSDAFYIVLKGAIRITTINSEGNLVFLARIGEKSFFGEQALSLTSSPRRRATATAQIETLLYCFPRKVLLSLNVSKEQFKKSLQTSDIEYLKKKLKRLSSHIQNPEYLIEKMGKNSKCYPIRSIIFDQGDIAKKAFILLSGEVELRAYDIDKQLTTSIRISPGQIFGEEGLDENKIYHYLAVVQHEAVVIPIDSPTDKQIVLNNPILKEWIHFNKQDRLYSKVNTFQSDYSGMPAITSLINLNDGLELICHQVIGRNMFLASITGITSDQEITFIKKNQRRELYLRDYKIVGLLDYGRFEDSYQFIKMMIDGTILSENQLNKFTQQGHIQTQEDTKSNEFLCKCMRVSYKTINRMINTERVSLSDISHRTGAATVCGGCKPQILEMLGTDAWHLCRVIHVIRHQPDIMSFQIQPINKPIMSYKAGQNIVIKTKINDVWVQRPYTLTSTSDEAYYEITIKKEPHGLFSPWLFEHTHENLMVYISGPYGNFILDSAQDKPIICFMGGIGITPAIAFMRYLVKTGISQPFYLDYSALTSNQFIFLNDFFSLSKRSRLFSIYHRTTSICGTLTEKNIEDIVSSLDDCHIYICGPKGLETLVTNTLNRLQIPFDRIHKEEFIHAGSPEISPQMINLG